MSAFTPDNVAEVEMNASHSLGGGMYAQRFSTNNYMMGSYLNNFENLPNMIAGAMGNDTAHKNDRTIQFCSFYTIEKNPPIQEVADSNVIPQIVEVLQQDENQPYKLRQHGHSQTLHPIVKRES